MHFLGLIERSNDCETELQLKAGRSRLVGVGTMREQFGQSRNQLEASATSTLTTMVAPRGARTFMRNWFAIEVHFPSSVLA